MFLSFFPFSLFSQQKKKKSVNSLTFLHLHLHLHLHKNKTKIIFVRHGEHAYLNDTDTPCMSEVGMARAVMLTRYLSRPDAPKGVLPPTMVYAMNGNTKESDPPTVRPINSAIPYVVAKKIARDKFVTRFGQRTPADVAASMLSEGKGEVVLNIWLHWEVPPMINFMGVPVTGWNNDNLDEETQATYKVRGERGRGALGRRRRREREREKRKFRSPLSLSQNENKNKNDKNDNKQRQNNNSLSSS